MAGFQFVSPDIAVDIGTDNTRVYVKEKGIVVNEPSVVITRGEGPRNIVAVGDSAEEMIGRAGGNIRIIHPLRDGVIVDYEMAQVMIHYFVSKAIGTAGQLCGGYRRRHDGSCACFYGRRRVVAFGSRGGQQD